MHVYSGPFSAPLKFKNVWLIPPKRPCARDYLSTLRLTLFHVSKVKVVPDGKEVELSIMEHVSCRDIACIVGRYVFLMDLHRTTRRCPIGYFRCTGYSYEYNIICLRESADDKIQVMIFPSGLKGDKIIDDTFVCNFLNENVFLSTTVDRFCRNVVKIIFYLDGSITSDYFIFF